MNGNRASPFLLLGTTRQNRPLSLILPLDWFQSLLRENAPRRATWLFLVSLAWTSCSREPEEADGQ